MGIDQLIPPGCTKVPLTRVGGAPCVAVYALSITCVPARTATGNITFSSINFSPSERASERASVRSDLDAHLENDNEVGRGGEEGGRGGH